MMMYKNTQKGGGAQITTLADQSVLTAAGSGGGDGGTACFNCFSRRDAEDVPSF